MKDRLTIPLITIIAVLIAIVVVAQMAIQN